VLIAIGIAIVLLVGLLLVRGLRGAGGQRDTAQVIAAVQAERDVLRANHAVEIATLESKLEEAQERARRNMDASLRLKEAERQLADANATVARLQEEMDQQARRIEALAAERDELAGRIHEVPQIVSERDRARNEVAEQSEVISKLRADLQEAINRAGRATVDRADEEERLNALARERDEARDEARRLAETVGELRQEVSGLKDEAAKAAAADPERTQLASEVKALKEREEHLQGIVRAREATIAELRQALSTGPPAAQDDGEVARLRQQLEEAQQREKAANESLSRLAYEADGLRNRLAGLERTESESKAEVEKREAVLELRLQKIYELEAKLRDQHAQLRETQRRAELAEESLAALSAQAGGEVPSATPPAGESVATPAAEADERIERLEAELDQAREDNAALRAETEALRAAAGGAGADGGEVEAAVAALEADRDAAREQVAALQAEKAALEERLRAAEGAVAASAPDGAAIEALRGQLRELAMRFVEQSGTPEVEEAPEPSLAERIRAFKAARAAEKRTASGKG
jgi:chromosome segregation ATPase